MAVTGPTRFCICGICEVNVDDILQIIVTVICSVIASSGFWVFIQKRMERKDAKTKLLVGLAHDRIMTLGTYYINRGYISAEEFEDLDKYLYAPYKNSGGNGSAERIMEQVRKLPISPEQGDHTM